MLRTKGRVYGDYNHGFVGFPNDAQEFILQISLLYCRLPQIPQNLNLTGKLAQKHSKKNLLQL